MADPQRSLLRRAAQKLLVRPTHYLRKYSAPHYTVYDELDLRIARDTADYVVAHMSDAIVCTTRQPLWDLALSKVTLEGLWAEFGVFQGRSINHFAAAASKRPGGAAIRIYGFDSFAGLKEDWGGTDAPKGTFDLGGVLPKVAPSVTLIKGWFDQTLPGFLKDHPGHFAFVHIDSDTYPAAKVVLEQIGDRIVAGTVVVFDDYFGYLNWRNGEHKAWQEFVSAAGIKYHYFGFTAECVALTVESRR